jgi:hypothetical protein
MGSEKEQTFTDTCRGCQKKIKKAARKEKKRKKRTHQQKPAAFLFITNN